MVFDEGSILAQRNSSEHLRIGPAPATLPQLVDSALTPGSPSGVSLVPAALPVPASDGDGNPTVLP